VQPKEGGERKSNSSSPETHWATVIPPRDSRELLFDSEAILRLVDGALTDLRLPREANDGESHPPRGETEARGGAVDVPSLLARLSTTLDRLLEDLRRSRAQLPARRLHGLYAGASKLEDLSSASAMLDRLGRALLLVDAVEGRVETDTGVEPISQIRHELFGLMNCLQFHNDTSERLNDAARLLAETETKLEEMAGMIDPLRLVKAGTHR
jgi:hypothetical protein